MLGDAKKCQEMPGDSKRFQVILGDSKGIDSSLEPVGESVIGGPRTQRLCWLEASDCSCGDAGWGRYFPIGIFSSS